ncbi:uncharacterized protein PHALS_15284 [Plasmopara halstedii]|uniref:Uncharacterized protein n=1 Tax=Plasmopara halstedii TaxID=4781 RepID=A0A0N7L496_PLAHL|nr:uncharacterized protein PHALS_15284 [Plasmopara halstedii]CEG38059.1 hypothetical protein PHALS_15284 [Plasmopara halstedii]|eukprot:XP_024574428.1 hypothetical protein PHALS_15284 [Plasmopara halstedii]
MQCNDVEKINCKIDKRWSIKMQVSSVERHNFLHSRERNRLIQPDLKFVYELGSRSTVKGT